MCMGVSTLKERRKEEILIYGLLQISSLIHHAVPVHAAFTPRQGAPLPLRAADSSSRLGNKLRAPTRPPEKKKKKKPSSSLLLSHSSTQRRTMTGLLTTRDALKYGRARYVRTNTSCHSPSAFSFPWLCLSDDLSLVGIIKGLFPKSILIFQLKCSPEEIKHGVKFIHVAFTEQLWLSAQILVQEVTSQRNKCQLLHYSRKQSDNCTCVIPAHLIMLK